MAILNSNQQPIIGWRSLVVTQVVNAVDADATAFIAAAGITNLTQAAAINTLVNDLKTYGLWTKMKALYPMVGGTATSHKFNLKDPRDLDAAFRLVFSGGWTHTSTGALPNGSNTYATTQLNPLSVLSSSSAHLSYYSRTSAGFVGYDIGSIQTSNTTQFALITRYSGDKQYAFAGNYSTTSPLATNTDGSGFYIANRNSSTNTTGFKNNLKNIDTIQTSGLPNVNLYIGAYFQNGTNVGGYGNKESAFASIGDGLSDTDATNFYNSVQKFQTTLGRQIGSPIVSDTDAQAFINAAGLTDLGQANAVNTLVVDLKAAGVWTKMKALYPFVGGTATTHKFNLKDPRDVDAAFRLVFNGGWTHTSTGALPNGTTGYADTKMLPASYMTSSTLNHMSYYSRTNTAKLSEYVMGLWTGTKGFSMILRRDNNSQTFISDSLSTSYRAAGNTLSTDSRGFYIGTQQGANIKLFRNDILQASNTVASTNTSIPDVYTIYLGALNYMGTPSDTCTNKETAFASIGDGLTDTEASVFYTAVQKYQTSLGRQIGTPVLADGQTAGLLETYSGAAAAYSLRKLRTGYVGNAIRVRRSSDNAEQDIAFDASGNLDTTSLLAFVGSGNGFVTTWYDQSGFNNHITQTTAGNQPQIVSSGVVKLLNNKPSIYFDGGNYYFNSSTQTVLSSGSGGYSIFGTAKPSGTSGPKCLFYIGSASGNNGVGFNLSNTQPRHYWFANDFDTSQTFSDTNTIYAVSYDGSKRYTAINNVTQSQNATGKNTTSPTLMVGRLQSYGQFFIGLQSELIIYNSYKDTSITNIYGSMNSYYSIY